MKNKMEKENYRHGDVVLVPTNTIEGEEQEKPILALGEVTGHSHQIKV
jgi:hypothetical protein